MDNEQLQPDRVDNATSKSPASSIEQHDLSHYFWLGLVLVFFMERWLSHKNKLKTANG
jgi:hypothetical protein